MLFLLSISLWVSPSGELSLLPQVSVATALSSKEDGKAFLLSLFQLDPNWFKKENRLCLRLWVEGISTRVHCMALICAFDACYSEEESRHGLFGGLRPSTQ